MRRVSDRTRDSECDGRVHCAITQGRTVDCRQPRGNGGILLFHARITLFWSGRSVLERALEEGGEGWGAGGVLHAPPTADIAGAAQAWNEAEMMDQVGKGSALLTKGEDQDAAAVRVEEWYEEGVSRRSESGAAG